MERKLLIIDDDLSYVSVVEKQMLDEGYEVILANTTKKINNYLKSNFPDIVLLDVLMNNKKGLDILKDLSFMSKVAAPIIVISRGKDIHLIEKAFKYGAYDYLIKPLNLKDLKNKIIYALEQRKTKSKKVYHV